MLGARNASLRVGEISCLGLLNLMTMREEIVHVHKKE